MHTGSDEKLDSGQGLGTTLKSCQPIAPLGIHYDHLHMCEAHLVA